MPNEEKPKKYEPEALGFKPTELVPPPDAVQDSFRYGKSIEKLSSKQIKGGSGNYAVGSSSRSTTGTQSFTVWFKPKLVRINAVYASSAGWVSNGSATSPASQFNVNSFANPSAAAWSYGSTVVSVNWTGAGTSVASLQSMDASGFTLNWTSIWPPVNFYYECFG